MKQSLWDNDRIRGYVIYVRGFWRDWVPTGFLKKLLRTGVPPENFYGRRRYDEHMDWIVDQEVHKQLRRMRAQAEWDAGNPFKALRVFLWG